jgi:hypothetical protein
MLIVLAGERIGHRGEGEGVPASLTSFGEAASELVLTSR